MIASLLDSIFGCSHKRTTFPITPSRRSQLTDGVRKRTYVCCLDCGKELDYDWKEMRLGVSHMPAPKPAPSLSIVNQ